MRYTILKRARTKSSKNFLSEKFEESGETLNRKDPTFSTSRIFRISSMPSQSAACSSANIFHGSAIEIWSTLEVWGKGQERGFRPGLCLLEVYPSHHRIACFVSFRFAGGRGCSSRIAAEVHYYCTAQDPIGSEYFLTTWCFAAVLDLV